MGFGTVWKTARIAVHLSERNSTAQGVALVLLLLPVTATWGQSKDPDVQQLQQAVEQLQQTVTAQSAKISALEKEASAPPVEIEIIGPEGEVEQPFVVFRNSRSPAQKLAPRLNNVSIVPKETPGFIVIPGTKGQLQVGGDITAVFTESSKYFSPTQMITSTIPVSGQPFALSHAQFAFTANQSDISFEYRTPSPLGQLRIVYNNDFSQPAQGFAFHLNYFYAQAGNLLVGFSNTVFSDVDSYPSTLDYAGVNSLVSASHAMLSYAVILDKNASRHIYFKFSVEVPNPQVSAAPDVSRSIAPDVGAQFRVAGNTGHLQIATILRFVGAQSPSTGSTQTVFGWGLNLTGGLNLWGGDFLSAGAAGGQGVAAYFNDTGGSGLDAALNGAGQLTALPIFGCFVGYTHNWASQWTSTASYGFLTMSDTTYQASLGAGAFHQTQYASLNVVYHPWPKLLVGIEGLYGFHKTVSEASGDAWRGQMTVQYTF